MKTLKLLFCLLTISIGIQAQVVEYLYDFNDYNIADLDGQDDWVTILHITGPHDIFVDLAAGSVVSPDGTYAAFYNGSGTGYDRKATRKATSNFDFDFTASGAGFDADGDGHIAPGLNSKVFDFMDRN